MHTGFTNSASNVLLSRPGTGGDPADPILTLFANGEQGAYAYPTNQKAPDGDYISFQDAGATIPATSSTDPVRFIRDLTPNDNHFIAPNDASRPLLVLSGGLWRWQFDGQDDYLETGNLSSHVFSPTTGVMCIGMTSNQADAIDGAIEEREAAITGNRVLIFSDTRSSPKRIAEYVPDGTIRYVDRSVRWDQSTQVVTAHTSGSNFVGRVNGSQVDVVAHNSASFVNTTILNIGRRADGVIYHNGDVFGLVARDNVGGIDAIESRIAQLSGVTL